MHVNITNLGESAYATIRGDGYIMDVRLSPGRSAAQSLRESSYELHEKAADITRRAIRIREAADHLENQRIQQAREEVE